MPELPEVEVVRRDLETEVAGRRIKAVEVDGARSIRRHADSDAFARRLVGRRITGVARRGKYLVCALDGVDLLVVHLGMSGQLLRARAGGDPLARHTHVVVTFTQGGQLRFVDPRTFGEVFVTEADESGGAPELAHLGPDPLDAARAWEEFGGRLTARRTKLKPLLMDQRFVAGLGNIYTDEILWRAGLRWDRPGASLDRAEVRRLAGSVTDTLTEAVRHRGSSLADEQYVDLFGRPGRFQHFHNVYAREGHACPRCRHSIVRDRFAGRSTFWCPTCQS